MAIIKFTPTPEAAPKSLDSRSIVAEPKSPDSRQPSSELLELLETAPKKKSNAEGYTPKKQENYKKWLDKQAQLSIKINPELKAQLDNHVKSRRESLRAFIIRACTNQIERDNESR